MTQQKKIKTADSWEPGLPDGFCFQTKNLNLGKFWRALDWKKFICFIAIWNILWRFEVFNDHLVHFSIHLVHFFGFGKIW
jgi:hypothetical protein